MRRSLLLLPLCALVGCAAPAVDETAAPVALVFPVARTVAVVDDYHGEKIADPYRWLEDLDAPDTRAWIAAQNALTERYLAAVPQRAAIHARMTELWNFERFGLPERAGERWIVGRNDGLQNQTVLYTLDALDGPMRVLLDPNTLSSDGTVALSGSEVSPDGRYLAWGASSGGSDWQEWRVREIASGKDTDDHLRWVKFSGASWARDASGFYYSRYDAPGENQLKAVNEQHQVWFHRLGTPQSEDVLVYRRPDQPKWLIGAEVSDDGRYLVLTVNAGSAGNNRVFYRDLAVAGGEVVELLPDDDAEYEFVGNQGPVFWFRSNAQAPRYRLIAIDTRKPDRANWRTLIAQSEATLQGVSFVGGQFIARYLHDARAEVRRHAQDGSLLGEVALPGIGTVAGFDGKPEASETFFSFASFTTPQEIHRLDLATGQTSLYRRPKIAFDPARFETRQVFYSSRDGTRVPMFITARKDLPRDGARPTILYGYGGFNIPLTPNFTVPVATWLERGGIYAAANLRGGGEYGEDWHRAGTRLAKQNVFDDAIAAAEYLIAQRYTNPQKLALYGRSNGGLLAAAVMLQRPDLFAAVLPGVGVLDMLRFNQFTIGWAWQSDYGSPQVPEEFAALRAYSPLHNIKAGVRYPATLVTTGDHDDRVFPAHSFKFTATQQALAAPGTYLARIETRGGHGAGKPTSMQIDEWTDMLSFATHELGAD
ncbi:MAG: S9 family peptidase [Xanthomonadales bacterium PRO6]|nr:Prolyl endopeptidase [Anaerolineae bacterium]MCE7931912.1 S9 family peptidase [Xanthomonadales bacterium PRO6]